jgi:hypothetical protein
VRVRNLVERRNWTGILAVLSSTCVALVVGSCELPEDDAAQPEEQQAATRVDAPIALPRIRANDVHVSHATRRAFLIAVAGTSRTRRQRRTGRLSRRRVHPPRQLSTFVCRSVRAAPLVRPRACVAVSVALLPSCYFVALEKYAVVFSKFLRSSRRADPVARNDRVTRGNRS